MKYTKELENNQQDGGVIHLVTEQHTVPPHSQLPTQFPITACPVFYVSLFTAICQ